MSKCSHWDCTRTASMLGELNEKFKQRGSDGEAAQRWSWKTNKSWIFREELCLLRSESLCEDYSRHRLTAVPRCQSSLGQHCVSRVLCVRAALLGSTQSRSENQWFVNSSYSQQLLLTTEWRARNPITNSHIWPDAWEKKNQNFEQTTGLTQTFQRNSCSAVCEHPFRSLGFRLRVRAILSFCFVSKPDHLHIWRLKWHRRLTMSHDTPLFGHFYLLKLYPIEQNEN